MADPSQSPRGAMAAKLPFCHRVPQRCTHAAVAALHERLRMNNGMNIASVMLKSVLSESRRRREDRKLASGPDASSTVNGTFAPRRTDPRRARKNRGGLWQDR
jgi:hypothetical protein